MLSLNYDKKYDILSIALGDTSNAIGCEEYDVLVVMRDYTTRIITGLMLYDFCEKYESNAMPTLIDGDIVEGGKVLEALGITRDN